LHCVSITNFFFFCRHRSPHADPSSPLDRAPESADPPDSASPLFRAHPSDSLPFVYFGKLKKRKTVKKKESNQKKGERKKQKKSRPPRIAPPLPRSRVPLPDRAFCIPPVWYFFWKVKKINKEETESQSPPLVGRAWPGSAALPTDAKTLHFLLPFSPSVSFFPSSPILCSPVLHLFPAT